MIRTCLLLGALSALFVACDDDEPSGTVDQAVAVDGATDGAAVDMAPPPLDMATPDMTAPAPDMATPDMTAPAPDMATPDMMAPAPDMAAPPPDMGAPADQGAPDMMAPAPDMGMPPACQNPAWNAACPASPDEATCVANGGQWGMFFRGDPGRCRCPTQDGGCPCQADGQCSQFCYVPVENGECSGLPARCYEFDVLSSCFCDPGGLGQACP
ncbi:MAG: hypothetical protein H6706_30930 [Myxococcales bacterium]|nr:hypothetical protein [Myxococcales bacterium]